MLGKIGKTDMSTEGAAQIQIAKTGNSFFACIWSAAPSALKFFLISFPA
jgi:hypothetical protein